MKAFELHFNPKKRKEEIFDSFVFEPETASEKPMGNLYMVGEFSKILPQNSRFLNNLAQTIKQEYYKNGQLTEALKKANEFLDKEARAGNVNWLGNLHFGVLSLREQKNCWLMNFSRSGEVRALISREGEILDISQNIELKDIEPYPLRVFGNVVTGRIAPQDKIMLMTKDIFSLLSQKGGFLNQLKDISEEKEVKNILKDNKKLLAEAAGICILLIVPFPATPKNKTFKKPALKIPALKWPFGGILARKSVKLSLALLLILLLGALIFSSPKQEESQLKDNSELLETVKAQIEQARQFHIIENKQKTAELLKEAQDILSGLQSEEADLLREEIKELWDMINGG